MSDKNLYWINAMKGICMIAVFYVHCMLLCGPRIQFASPEIHAFYVNGFFFISGYLLFWKQLTSPRINEPFKIYIHSGAKTLYNNILFRIIIPSVVFASFFYLPAKIVKHEDITLMDYILETIGGRTFWFTSALAVAELILLILFLFRKKSIWFYIICLMPIIVLGFYFAHDNPGTYALDIWAWRRGILSLIFLGLGGLYWNYEKIIDSVLSWWVCLILFVLMELIIYCLGDEDAMLVSMLTIQPLGIIPSLISVLLVVKISKIIPESKVLTFIGKYSLGFFFLCSGIPMILSVLCHRYIGENHLGMLFLVWIISMAISYLIIYILNKWLPCLFDLRVLKKGR